MTALLMALAVGVYPARADLEQSRQWFESMDSAERSQLQQDLYWVGAYKGKTDGAFGLETYSAITAYQRQRQLMPTGTLTAEDVAKLSSEGDRIRHIVRYQLTKKPSSFRTPRPKPKSIVSAPPKKKSSANRPGPYLRQPYVQPFAQRIGPRLSWVLILP
jgi:peptidoglycan hydrolase-like protein with peptidoglycan-binding domain